MTTIVTTTVAPEAIVPIVQRTTCPEPVHDPCVELEETYCTVAGSESATVTCVPVLGPLLWIVSV